MKEKELIREYVHKTPLPALRKLCDTAEEWHDGADMLYLFASRYGVLDSLADYKLLSAQCRATVKDELHNPAPGFAKWAIRLEDLAKYCDAIISINSHLSSIYKHARTLTRKYGVNPMTVTGAAHDGVAAK